jgi:hypothetical protein
VLVPTARPALTYRVIIPEASLWEPVSPHLYEGPLELWQDGHRCEVVALRHGLCHIVLGRRRLRVNGRPFHLYGRTVQTCNDEQALALRLLGCNLLVAPVSDEGSGVWDVADRLGFFVLGRVSTPEHAAQAQRLTGHASCLGWVMEGAGVEDLPPAPMLGAAPGAPGEAQANFLLVHAGAQREDSGKPVLVIGGSVEEAAAGRVLGVLEG